jgi:transcriptional regulator with XRE-family HTH domain
MAMVEQLRQARREAHLTQVELARLLDRPQSLVSDIESGQRRVDIVELRLICRHLGIPLSEFIARWEERLCQPSPEPEPE